MRFPRTTRVRAGAVALPRRFGTSTLPLARLFAAQRAALADVLAVFLPLLVGFYLLVLFATWMVPEYAGSAYPRWYTGADRLIDASWRWDGQWYMSIARDGYRLTSGYTNVAFFPLYPLLIRFVGLFLGAGGLPLAGVIVANLAFLGALFYLYRLAEGDGGRGLAQRAVWLVAVMPTAFFFHAAYSESLFLLTAAGSLYHLRRRLWWAAGLWAALGATTRAQGILLVLPLAWEMGRLWWKARVLPARQVGALALPFLGLGLFMGYLFLSFGDPLAFLHVQGAWGRSLGLPLFTVWNALQFALAGYRGAAYPLELLNIAIVFLYLALSLASLRRWPASYTLYALGSIAVALMLPSGGHTITSGARFMAVVFPPLFTLAAWSGRWPWLMTALLALSLPLYALLVTLFVNWYWVV